MSNDSCSARNMDVRRSRRSRRCSGRCWMSSGCRNRRAHSTGMPRGGRSGISRLPVRARVIGFVHWKCLEKPNVRRLGRLGLLACLSLAGCAGNGASLLEKQAEATTAALPVTPQPGKPTTVENASQPSQVQAKAAAVTATPSNRVVDAGAATPGPLTGRIVGFSKPIVTLYASQNMGAGQRIPSNAINLPLQLLPTSTRTMAHVQTVDGSRWISAADIIVSNGSPPR